MTSSLRMSLKGGPSLCALLFLLFQLSFSSANASSETIQVNGSNGPTQTGSDLGFLNPCEGVHAELASFVVPAGYSYQKTEWYGNGSLITTSTSSTAQVTLLITSPGTNHTFVVYAKVYYVGGSSVTSGTSNSITVNEKDIPLTITQGQSAVWGCSSPVSLTAGFNSQVGTTYYYFPTSDQYTISWTLPSGWTFSGSSAGNTVSVVPSPTGTTGNVTATLTMNCGFVRSITQAVTMSAPQPVFGSNPFAICNNSTNTFTISPLCGAANYTWTLSGNAGATFQSNGAQSLTTTSTSVVVSASSVGTTGANLSVTANYPGGTTSSASNYSIVTGILPAPTQVSPASGTEVLPPGSLAEFYSPGANMWSATNATITQGQGGPDAAFRVANIQSGNVTLRITAVDACGTSSALTAVYAISSGPNPLIAHPSSSDSAASAQGDFNTEAAQLATRAGLYPNPADNSVEVVIPATDFKKAFIKIYDLNGHLLQVITPSSSKTLVDISHQSKGVYIVEIFDGKTMITKKLVKK